MSAFRNFSSQADPEVLQGLQEVATREGRLFQAVLGDAMRAYSSSTLSRRSRLRGFAGKPGRRTTICIGPWLSDGVRYHR